MSYIMTLIFGILIGWLIFKQPEKVTEFYTWLKSKIVGG